MIILTLREIGERKLVERMIKLFEPMPNAPMEFWDDASGVNIDGGKVAILQTDMLVWETDVPPGMTFRQAGRKAVVMSVSDLAAKGVQPIAILPSLGLPKNLKTEEAEEIARGLNQGAREYGAWIIGGDTNEAKDIIINCTAFGICERGKIMKRSGAKPGDILATTGEFGKTAAGLKILLEEIPVQEKLRKTLIQSVLMPKARLREGIALAQTGAVTASIDSSDGLAMSLHDLSRSSGVGFTIEKLPTAEEAKKFAETQNMNPEQLTLYGGEEYELVFTVKPQLIEEVKKALKKVGTQLIEIGHATKERRIILKTEEEEKPIPPKGWNHFTKTNPQ